MPSMPSLASLGPSPSGSPLLGTAGTDAAVAASLLGLQGMGASSGAYVPSPSAGLSLGGAGLGLGAAAYAGYGQLTAGQLTGPELGCSDSSTLAALAALLANGGIDCGVGAAAGGQPVSAAAALATSSHSLLGMVGPPAGLSPIGTLAGSASSAAGPGLAQAPSCPGTPGGTSARTALRLSISGGPRSSRKRKSTVWGRVSEGSWYSFQC